MSCYTRHLKPIFAEAGVDYSLPNRRAADSILRDLLGMPQAKCSDVWHELKHWLAQPSPRALVIEDLRDHLSALQRQV